MRPAGGRFNTYGAGSHPAGEVHRLALEQIETIGYPLEQLRSKSWNEFATDDAPHMDFVITVCDKAAGEVPRRCEGGTSRKWHLPRLNYREVHGEAAGSVLIPT